MKEHRDLSKDIMGVGLITLGLLLFVSVVTEKAFVLYYVATGLKWTIGWVRYLVPFFVLSVGIGFLIRKTRENIEAFSFGFVLAALAITIVVHLRVPINQSFQPGYVFTYGGLIGAAFSQILVRMIGVVGTYILVAGGLTMAVLFITNKSVAELIGYISQIVKLVSGARKSKVSKKATPGRQVSQSIVDANKTSRINLPISKRNIVLPESATVEETVDYRKDEPVEERSRQLTMNLKTKETKTGYSPPSISLLRRTKSRQLAMDRSQKEQAMILEQTLRDFGIQASVNRVVQGPTVTRFELQIATGVKVSRLVNLTDDIALALASPEVRVLAPIPGKSAVGIEIASQTRGLVTLGDVLSTPEAERYTTPLSFAIGKDISGKPVLADLGDMPHLLIAGATGSGKSICINSILMSMLMKAYPDQLKLILVDPKRVELSMYNGLPHLLVPVITKPKEAATGLVWAVGEMESRFELLSQAKVRNINGYNRKLELGKLEGESLPYIVIVVDELADLMMAAAGEVEDAICRLAQMARAVGIHLVVATQRPSSDIITGLIKANITARIAFSVSSQVDSRVILDSPGAEKLVGRGDLLYQAPDSSQLRRIQGSYVSEKEVELVTSYIKSQAKPSYNNEVLEDKKSKFGFEDFEDELYDVAMELVVNTGHASTSMLQRRLRIGYSRAARLIDLLEHRGIVSPLDGSKPREVLITPEELKEKKEGNRSLSNSDE